MTLRDPFLASLLLSLIALAGCVSKTAALQTAGTTGPASATSGSPSATCEPVGTSTHFALYSDPWINLHHLLFQWAFAETEHRPDDHRRALTVPEREQLHELTEPERAAWSRALGYYSREIVGHDLLWDREMAELSNQLTKVSCSGAAALAGLPSELRGVLEEAMPIYRRHWWSSHNASNVTWIRGLMSELPGLETRLSDQLSRAYGGQWPAGRLRVDVTTYANEFKGYTTNHPDHITLTSTDPDKQGLVGLETLFHEASHASGLEEPLQAQLDAAFARQGGKAPRGLSHVIQFFTPAKLLSTLLRERGVSTYESYAERAGLYQRVPSFDRYRAVLEQDWSPFLAGKIERTEAFARIAQELSSKDESTPQHPGGASNQPGRPSVP